MNSHLDEHVMLDQKHTFDMWTPKLLCMPEHLMQINTPRLEDLMFNK